MIFFSTKLILYTNFISIECLIISPLYCTAKHLCFKSVENSILNWKLHFWKTMKGGVLVFLAILGLVIPLFAAKEGPETLEIPEDKMNEDLDFGDFEDSDDRSDEDSDEDYDELDR